MDAVIILCAGRGTRMAQIENKVLTSIAGRPVFIWSVMAFEEALEPEKMVLVGRTDELPLLKAQMIQYCPKMHERTTYVVGGQTRQSSVLNGLISLKNAEISNVYVHDGARPLVNQEMIIRVREGLKTHAAICVGMPVKDTLKIVSNEGFVVDTPDRSQYWLVQTPQAFHKPILTEAYEKALAENFQGTDDASLVEWSGKRVVMEKGCYENIKITTPEDLIIATILLEKGGRI